MDEPEEAQAERRRIDRLVDENEQLRTALEAAEEESTRLAEDRDRLLHRVTALSRDLQTANAAYAKEKATRAASGSGDDHLRLASTSQQEELRVALKEMQVLTEELEVANASLREANQALDRRVEERTREIECKNHALAESEARFRTLVEGIPQLVWTAVDGGEWTWASPQWTSYTGLDLDESLGPGWLQALHPADQEQARLAWERAEAGEKLDMSVRIYHRAEERYRHFRVRATAVGHDGAQAPMWLGTATDIDDLRELQARQQLLLAELQHRVRNMLTVVRSVFSRSAERSVELEHLVQHFQGRLAALARTHVVVTRHARGMVALEEMIRDELLSIGVSDGPKLRLDGPEVELDGRTAETLSLAIHELTTNALKYGAFSRSGGSLALTWKLDAGESGRQRLEIKWSEQGVPIVGVAPSRTGFGRELLEEIMPYQLKADVKLEFRGGGICCRISLPLANDEARRSRPER